MLECSRIKADLYRGCFVKKEFFVRFMLGLAAGSVAASLVAISAAVAAKLVM